MQWIDVGGGAWLGAGGGGSGYVGGCSNPGSATMLQGYSGSSSSTVLPPQTTLAGYVAGVGVGSAGSNSATLPMNGGNGFATITISSCIFPFRLASGGGCVCSAGYYMTGGMCAICPVGSCCLGDLNAAAPCGGSTTIGAAVVASE